MQFIQGVLYSSEYDSMIAEVIVHALDRDAALQKTEISSYWDGDIRNQLQTLISVSAME